MKSPNLVAYTIRKLKNLLIKPGSKPIKIKFGLGRGISMELDPAHHTQRIYGLYEREITQTVRQYALEANTIVDVGAHDGYYTVTLSVINPRAKIFACEPESELKHECLKSLELNGMNFNGRITWIPQLIGLEQQEDYISLDNLLREAKEPIFIKMDIDGGELESLQSGTEVLKSKSCLLVVETHSKQLEKDCISYLSNLGYQCQIIPNSWWRFFVPEDRLVEQNRWFLAQKSHQGGT